MDERLRQAQRAAALSGSMEAIEGLALEAARSGTRTDWIVGLLRAWPRLKRGDFVAPDRLTYAQALAALQGTLQAMGWKQKPLTREDLCESCGHRLGRRSIEGGRCLECGSMLLPHYPAPMPGCPPERDGAEAQGRTVWIPEGAWASPDCQYYIELEGGRRATFFHWRDDPNSILALSATGGVPVLAPPRWWHINNAHINEHPFEIMGSVPLRWGYCVISITEIAQWLYQQAIRVLGLRDVATEAQQRRTQLARRSPEHEELLDRVRAAALSGIHSEQYKEAQAALDAFLRAKRRRRKGPPQANPRGETRIRELERLLEHDPNRPDLWRELAFEQLRHGLELTPAGIEDAEEWPGYAHAWYYFPNGFYADVELVPNTDAPHGWPEHPLEMFGQDPSWAYPATGSPSGYRRYPARRPNLWWVFVTLGPRGPYDPNEPGAEEWWAGAVPEQAAALLDPRRRHELGAYDSHFIRGTLRFIFDVPVNDPQKGAKNFWRLPDVQGVLKAHLEVAMTPRGSSGPQQNPRETLTQEDWETIRSGVQLKRSAREIAEELGRPESTIVSALKRRGLWPQAAKHRWYDVSKFDRAVALLRADQTLSIAHAARRAGVSPDTLRNFLRSTNLLPEFADRFKTKASGKTREEVQQAARIKRRAIRLEVGEIYRDRRTDRLYLAVTPRRLLRYEHGRPVIREPSPIHVLEPDLPARFLAASWNLTMEDVERIAYEYLPKPRKRSTGSS